MTCLMSLHILCLYIITLYKRTSQWMALAYSLCWSGSRWHAWYLCTSCACTLLHSTKGLVNWMALAYSLCWSGSRGHVWCLCTSCACTLLHSTKGLAMLMALAYSLCWSGSRWHAWYLCTSCACTLLLYKRTSPLDGTGLLTVLKR